jgi:DNA-binding XRE family transcriptional regulator
MATMKRPRLLAVEPLADYQLRLTFVDNSIYNVSLASEIERCQGLHPLKEPSEFNKASLIADEGWTVEWEDLDIQIGADTLWLDAQAQNAPDDNTRVFAQWRARHGLSLAEAAKALGMTPRTMSAYGTGKRPVPRYIALACKGWEAERENA